MVKHMPDMRTLFAGAGEIKIGRPWWTIRSHVHPGAKRYYDEKGVK